MFLDGFTVWGAKANLDIDDEQRALVSREGSLDIRSVVLPDGHVKTLLGFITQGFVGNFEHSLV